jgi:hypothetical protein
MLAAAADLLDQGQPVNRLSIAVTAIGVGVLLIPMVPASAATQPIAGAVALVGLAELMLAGRVALSAAQFRRLAQDATAEQLDINAFDTALVSLKLMTVKQAGRPIARRFGIARRFLVAQVAALVIQVIAALVGGLTLFFGWF